MRILDGSQASLYQVDQHRTPGTQRVDAGNPSQSRDRAATLDRLEVSDLAQTVARVLDHNEASRANEIEALKLAYADGALETEPLAIARALLQDAVAGERLDRESVL